MEKPRRIVELSYYYLNFLGWPKWLYEIVLSTVLVEIQKNYDRY